MKTPMYGRPLTSPESRQWAVARRSANAFRVRRSQMILASACGHSATPIAPRVGCAVQTVRHVIRAFNPDGVVCLATPSNRPKSTTPSWDAAQCERLRHLLHQAPRTFGQPTGLWTLALAAQVSPAHGLTARRLSDETVRRALKRLGASWKRAQHWITSPEPQDARNKQPGIA